MQLINTDTEIAVCLRQILQARDSDPEDMLSQSRKLLSHAQQLNNAYMTAYATFCIGEAYYNLRNDSKALEYLSMSSQFLLDESDFETAARCYNLIGSVYVNRQDFSSAIDNYCTGLNICTTHNIRYTASVININIARMYLNIEDYKTAISFFETAVRGFRRCKRDKVISKNYVYALALLGFCYCRREMNDKATSVFNELESIFKNGDLSKNHSTIYMFYASYYVTVLKRRDLLLSDFDEFMKHPADKPAFLHFYNDYLIIGRILLSCGELDACGTLLSYMDGFMADYSFLTFDVIFYEYQRLKVEYYSQSGDQAKLYNSLEQYYLVNREKKHTEVRLATDILNMRMNYEKKALAQAMLEKKQASLQTDSSTDAMTGIYNRYGLMEHANAVYSQAVIEHAAFAVEIFDIDFFKEYNDTHGHQAGDDLLKKLGQMLLSFSNEKVICARYGGDEFIIVYSHMTLEEVRNTADAFRKKLDELAYPHRSSKISDHVTVSQGIFYSLPGKQLKLWDFLKYADLALYVLKKSTRNGIHISCDPSDFEEGDLQVVMADRMGETSLS